MGGERGQPQGPETWEVAGPQPPAGSLVSWGVSATDRRPKASTLHTPLTLHCTVTRVQDVATL